MEREGVSKCGSRMEQMRAFSIKEDVAAGRSQSWQSLWLRAAMQGLAQMDQKWLIVRKAFDGTKVQLDNIARNAKGNRGR